MRITFNGKEYASVEEMPAEVRSAYEKVAGLLEDRNQDGIPDIVQGGGSQHFMVTQTRIFFDGKTYGSVDELPPEARHQYEEALAKLNQPSHGSSTLGPGAEGGLQEVRKTVVINGPTIRFSGPGSLVGSPKSLLLSVGTVLLAALLAGALAFGYLLLRLR